MNKRCIIIGSEGFLGKHITHYAEQFGFDIVHCYDVVPASRHPKYSCINLTDKKSLTEIDVNVDYIFMFAGLSGTHMGFNSYENFMTINEIGLLHLLDLMKDRNSKARIIFPSSRLVYKGSDKAIKEDDPKDPKTIYAINKLSGEQFLKIYANSFDLSFTVFRIGIPYGNEISGDYSYGTIGFFLKMALSGGPITLYGGGLQKRTFSHVSDICRQIFLAISFPQSKNEIYNIAGECLSLHEVAELINRNYNVEIQNIEWPQKDLRIELGDSFFDYSKINNLIEKPLLKSIYKIDF